jgi:hypothetical protein
LWCSIGPTRFEDEVRWPYEEADSIRTCPYGLGLLPAVAGSSSVVYALSYSSLYVIPADDLAAFIAEHPERSSPLHRFRPVLHVLSEAQLGSSLDT